MKRNKLWIPSLGAILAGSILVTQGLGQPGAEPERARSMGAGARVAVLDFVRIFDECAQIKHLNETIRDKETEIQTEAQQRKKVIENKQVELSAFQRGTPDFETRRKELMRLTIEANAWLQASEQDLERERFDWTRIIYEKALRVSAEIAKSQGFDVVIQHKEFKPDGIEPTVASIRRVIQQRNLVYHVPEIDITDRVIRRLDEQYRASGGTE